MNQRKRNNIIIGVLCCALVFMGVGYAILSSVLTITSTANIKGDFDIHFLTEDNLTTETGVTKRGITLVDYTNSTSSNTVYNTTVTSKAAEMEAATGVDTLDSKVAEFDAILQKPTDYATFTAIAKNYGTIKGIISDVTITSTPSQELSTWLSTNGGTYSDYFEVTSTAAVDTVINPGSEYQFTVTVRFKESATKLPEGALNNTIEITYVQDNGQTYSQSGSGSSQEANLTWYTYTSGNDTLEVALDEDKTMTHYIVNNQDQIESVEASVGQVQFTAFNNDTIDINTVGVTPVAGDYIWSITVPSGQPDAGSVVMMALIHGNTLYLYDSDSNSVLELHEVSGSGSQSSGLSTYTGTAVYSAFEGQTISLTLQDEQNGTKTVAEFIVGQQDMTSMAQVMVFVPYGSHESFGDNNHLGITPGSGDYLVVISGELAALLHDNTVYMQFDIGENRAVEHLTLDTSGSGGGSSSNSNTIRWYRGTTDQYNHTIEVSVNSSNQITHYLFDGSDNFSEPVQLVSYEPSIQFSNNSVDAIPQAGDLVAVDNGTLMFLLRGNTLYCFNGTVTLDD